MAKGNERFSENNSISRLMFCATFGRIKEVKEYLSEPDINVFLQDEDGNTAINKTLYAIMRHYRDEQDTTNLWEIIDLLLAHEVMLHQRRIIQINAQHSGSEEWLDEMLASRLSQRQWQVLNNFRTSPIKYSDDSESYSVITAKIRYHEEQIQTLYDDRFVMPADWKPEHGLEALIPKPVSIEQHDEHESPPRSRSGSGEGLKESFYRGITSVAAAAGSVLGGLFSLGSPQPDPARQPLVPVAHVKSA